MRTLLALITLVVCLGFSAALASPWVLPRGLLVMGARFDYEAANEQWLNEGGARPFSLNGTYQATTFTLSGRYGVTDRLELAMALPLRQVGYESDPVLLDAQPAGDDRDALDYYQTRILDFSRNDRGLGDLTLAGRYQLFRGPRVGALGLTLKLPTGYAPPGGTFARAPKSTAEFDALKDEFVHPDNIEDDVTLGDGQMDATLRFLFGWAFASGTFARADLGYTLRLGGAGDQIVASTRVGQQFAGGFMLFTGLDAAIAVQDGDAIGVSIAAIDPNRPATEYRGTDNLRLRTVTLDHDRVVLPVGAIVRITPEAELNFGYAWTIWGRNTAKIQSASLGFAVHTNPL
jgi:hypothetical protein